MKRRLVVAVAIVALGVTAGCDTAEVVESEEVQAVVEEPVLAELLVGLWERDVPTATIGWLFKKDGVFHIGEPRPFFPVVGRWALAGDTLQVTDPGCLDRGFYRIRIDENSLTASFLDDSCTGRRQTLVGTWQRFVYGQ